MYNDKKDLCLPQQLRCGTRTIRGNIPGLRFVCLFVMSEATSEHTFIQDWAERPYKSYRFLFGETPSFCSTQRSDVHRQKIGTV